MENYWLNMFRDGIVRLNLPIDFDRNNLKTTESNYLFIGSSNDNYNKLKIIARENNCTIFNVVLAVYYIFLSKLSNEKEIVVGTEISGRTNSEIENIVGLFINTLALKSTVPEDLNFHEYLQIVKHDVIGAYDNQNYPFGNHVINKEFRQN